MDPTVASRLLRFPVRAELKFLIGEPVTVNTKIPCPSK